MSRVESGLLESAIGKTTDDVQTTSIQFTSVFVNNLNSKFDIYLSV